MRDYQPGEWVTVRRMRYQPGAGMLVPGDTIIAKFIARTPTTLKLERWELARITRRVKVYGHYVDKTPYREGGEWTLYGDGMAGGNSYWIDLRPLPTALVASAEARLASVLRYPTKVDRDCARAKRKAVTS